MDWNLAQSIGIVVAGFFLAVVGTRLVIGAASRRGVIDHPNARSSHSRPLPRGGGLSVVAVFLVYLATSLLTDQPAVVHSTTLWLLLGGVAIATVGLFDDLGDVNPLWRFLVHLGAASAMLVLLPELPTLVIGSHVLEPGWFLAGLLVIAIVWFVNLFNFMDGIDGIAGVQALCMLSGAILVCLLEGNSTWILLLGFLGASVAGFLVWNWPPAKVFMGDVGSGFLGFSLAAIAIGTSIDGPMNLWSWTILGGVFLVDATVTLITRMLRRQSWYRPHRSHAYQNLSQKLQSHSKVTVGVLGINVLWLIPWAVAAARTPERGLLYSLIALAPVLAGAILAGAGREEFS